MLLTLMKEDKDVKGNEDDSDTDSTGEDDESLDLTSMLVDTEGLFYQVKLFVHFDGKILRRKVCQILGFSCFPKISQKLLHIIQS